MEVSLRPSIRYFLNSFYICSISFLNQCRPLSIGMGNIIKYFKYSISSLPYSLNEEDSKNNLIMKLDDFFHTRIIEAHNTIVSVIQSKIHDNDVILTFAS